MSQNFTPIPTDEAISLLAEGVHTGLRKGTEAKDSHDMWVMISQSETTAWGDAIAFAVWGLDYMGYAICKKEETNA